MPIDIQTLISQRPHLKDPLKLYDKCRRFDQQVTELLSKNKPAGPSAETKAYPPKNGAEISQLFASIFGLPSEVIEPLGSLLEDGKLDFMQLPTGETPKLVSLPYSDQELAGILFLLARPYFLALQESFGLSGSQWQDGNCPLCSAKPALTSVIEGPKRTLHCSFCGTSGPYRFIGCPGCGTVDAAKLNTIISEDEPGFRVVTCDECRSYVKVMESSVLQEMTIDMADLASLPLDIIAQQKGYHRQAPNPISLKDIE